MNNTYGYHSSIITQIQRLETYRLPELGVQIEAYHPGVFMEGAFFAGKVGNNGYTLKAGNRHFMYGVVRSGR